MIDPSCNVCGARLRPWFSRIDRQVYRCPSCQHIQVPAGVARSKNGRSIYEGQGAIFEIDGNEEYYLDEGTAEAAADKLTFVRRFRQTHGRLLDVGASFGHFLFAARESFDAYGVELNEAAAAWGIRRLGVCNTVGSLYEMPESLPPTFDVITMWDVIEHLDDPGQALAVCRARLDAGGWLFLSTPDAGAWTARLLGRRWYYQDPLQHINLFSKSNLYRILLDGGFTPKGATHFGRRYRIRYIANRLSYLAGAGLPAKLLGALRHMPKAIAEKHVAIKLFDVIGVAAQLE